MFGWRDLLHCRDLVWYIYHWLVLLLQWGFHFSLLAPVLSQGIWHLHMVQTGDNATDRHIFFNTWSVLGLLSLQYTAVLKVNQALSPLLHQLWNWGSQTLYQPSAGRISVCGEPLIHNPLRSRDPRLEVAWAPSMGTGAQGSAKGQGWLLAQRVEMASPTCCSGQKALVVWKETRDVYHTEAILAM